ncbi:hypothetical protein [Mangrovicoccus sp. HB161399]|uniref:hypothetical protein n=1 Tax=Mangrovicoccus sp. HB161399 TaxID=2720392 RepID=UPI0015559577|nr:hypothetical protein [Mangrovicoccus sp. HB161399]
MLRIFNRKSTDNDPFCGVAMGDKVKDTLTGFTGVVIAHAEHMTGCNQLYVLPQSEKENEIKDGHWFDIERIEKIGDRAVVVEARLTGADVPAPRADGARLRISSSAV